MEAERAAHLAAVQRIELIQQPGSIALAARHLIDVQLSQLQQALRRGSNLAYMPTL